MKLSNISMMGKLLVIIGIMGVSLAAVAAAGLVTLSQARTGVERVDETTAIVRAAARMRATIGEVGRMQYLVAADPSQIAEVEQRISAARDQFDNAMDRARAASPEALSGNLTRIQASLDGYQREVDATLELARAASDTQLTDTQQRLINQVRASRQTGN